MRLTAMRFKDYTWPHNPEIYTVENRRRVAVHQIPFGRCVLQDLGSSYRVFRGEGAFVGREAYAQFKELEAVFRSEGPGQLIHPVWQAQPAYFVSLRLTEEPLPEYVRYSFEFWEDCGSGINGLRKREEDAPSLLPQTAAVSGTDTYTVKKGDTLWGISKRYGKDLAAMIAANPQIKNPNLIYPGDEVKIP